MKSEGLEPGLGFKHSVSYRHVLSQLQCHVHQKFQVCSLHIISLWCNCESFQFSTNMKVKAQVKTTSGLTGSSPNQFSKSASRTVSHGKVSSTKSCGSVALH
jgi:hypothetical protein